MVDMPLTPCKQCDVSLSIQRGQLEQAVSDLKHNLPAAYLSLAGIVHMPTMMLVGASYMIAGLTAQVCMSHT